MLEDAEFAAARREEVSRGVREVLVNIFRKAREKKGKRKKERENAHPHCISTKVKK